MLQPTSACDPSLLARYLAEQLTSDERSRVETHLDQCEACRRELEQSAADADTWHEARQFLRDDPIDVHRLTELPVDGEPSEPGQAEEAADGLPIHSAERVLQWLAPTDDPQMLGRLGGYEILGVVGAGGMGVVLKGYDAPLNRVVAIKVLAPHLASSGAARRRFAREAQAAAAVVHPHVVAIHAVSGDAELPYLVMPYLRGMSLQKRLDQRGPLCTPEILRIASQTAAGLAAAHAQGLVHRDIKPANIMLEEGVERVAITDFGLARAVDDATTTRSGVIAGTPQYMSPEQARGEAIDHRSDLFSLGSVIYAMCTGHSPFRAETTFGILRRITDHTPRPLREVNAEVPLWLCRLVERLLAKEPRERFQSAEEVAEVLEQCLAHVQQPATAKLPVELRRKRWSPTRRRSVAGLLLFLALGVGLLAGHRQLSVPRDSDAGNSTSVRSDGFPHAISLDLEGSASERTAWPDPQGPVTDSAAAVSSLPVDDLYWGKADAEDLEAISHRLRQLEEAAETWLSQPSADRLEELTHPTFSP